MYLALFALFLATFSVGTTEFVISGILPAMALDLGVSIPTAGLLVTGYAIGVAIGGPIMTLLAARVPRKAALLGILGLFIAAHVLCALAPDYNILMGGRVLAAACHGAFNGLAIVLAASLAPEGKRGTALSVVLAAVPVANILGVPSGTLIGNTYGWRMTFWMVLVLALIGLVAIAILIKEVRQSGPGNSLARQLKALGNQEVLTSYAIIVVMMIGFWSINTFLAPYLTDVGGIPSAWVAGVLLLCGLGGTFGTFLGGRFANRHATQTIVVGFPLMALVYLSFFLFSSGNAIAASTLFGVLWLVGMTVVISLQARVISGAKDAPELASTLISSVFNVGIAIGAWLGATSLSNGQPLTQLPLYGMTSCVLATVIGLGAMMWERRLRARAL